MCRKRRRTIRKSNRAHRGGVADLMRTMLLLPLLAISGLALAQTTPDPPLPRDRPDAVEPAIAEPAQDADPADPAAAPEAAPEPVIPLPRRPPEPAAEPAPDAAPSADEAQGEPAEPKPPRIYQTMCPAVVVGLVQAEILPPIDEDGCGEQSPYEVSGVMANGRMVPLSSPATLNCEMASALPGWLSAIDGWAQARENSGLASVQVGTSYYCRNRNNAATGDLSEHGFANAMDVTGFTLENGDTISLPGGWADAGSTPGRMLRYAHDAACSTFSTVLGPEANALHEDHLHIDLGCHGRTCTARLCE